MKRDEGSKEETEKVTAKLAGSNPPTIITIPPKSEPLIVEEK
jgi:hypothetical protein